MQHDVTTYSQPSPADEPIVWKHCPYCAERILVAAVVCRYCGRDLVYRAWYRSNGWMVIWLLFLTPLWTALTLTDPQRKAFVKFVAVLFLLFYVSMVCSLLGNGY